MKRLAILDDDPDVRAELIELFMSEADFSLGPVAESGEELLCALSTDARVDLALVDLGLPGLSGAELIGRLRDEFPEVACVPHTRSDEPETVLACLRAGAAGYLLKGASGAELVSSLRTLAEGGAPLTPRIARLLLGEFRQGPKTTLSERELEVFGLLATGLSYKAIAAELVVSVHTIHTHVKRIYEKLQATGRRDALDKARRLGWLARP